MEKKAYEELYSLFNIEEKNAQISIPFNLQMPFEHCSILKNVNSITSGTTITGNDEKV